MRKGVLYILIFALLCGVFSCGNGEKNISREKLVDIMIDLEISSSMYDQKKELRLPGDINKEDLTNSVLQSHGVSVLELEKVLQKYMENTEEYEELQNLISEKLTLQIENLRERVAYEDSVADMRRKHIADSIRVVDSLKNISDSHGSPVD